MIVVQGESFALEKISRIQNSAYEWEDKIEITFFGRPANSVEKKQYRLQQGVDANQESVYILCSNMPKELKPGDKVRFNGTIYLVTSTGYYYNDSRIVNNKVMSTEYIIKRCPKGVVLS